MCHAVCGVRRIVYIVQFMLVKKSTLSSNCCVNALVSGVV